jgi:hypothetical protein
MRIYRDIIKQAWRVLWHYPWLWAFGLFAALVGNGSEYDLMINAVYRVSNQGAFWAALKEAAASDTIIQTWTNFLNAFSQAPVLFIWGLFLAGAVTLLIVWVLIVARASLIQAAGSIASGEPTNFTQAAVLGSKRFWPILLLNIITKFFTYLILIIAFLPFLISFLATPNASVSFNILILISFLVFVPLAVIISFILRYAAIFVVLEKENWWKALERSVNLFFRNWLVSLEMAAILFIINIVVSLVILFLLLPDTLTIKNELIAVIITQKINFVILIRLLLTVLLYVAVGTWYATFENTAWVMLFHRLRQGTVVAKLIRVTNDMPDYMGKWLGNVKPTTTPKK